GHEDIVRRSALLFDEIIVAVAVSRSKSTWFDLQERLAIAKAVFADQNKIRIAAFEGLLVDFMRQEAASVVIRGLRSVSDFDYEVPMAGMNRYMLPGMETVFLLPADDLAHVSGSLVREIAKLGGPFEAFVPQAVVDWVNNKRRASTPAHPAG
ncbi:MAG: pantetheine-phosphate adenylyltransferase, partial [Betaproteobacteria bacterium]|nr:pantetheine-phosphate adenylyltransferase [Betaproteobacteria bacterium]